MKLFWLDSIEIHTTAVLYTFFSLINLKKKLLRIFPNFAIKVLFELCLVEIRKEYKKENSIYLKIKKKTPQLAVWKNPTGVVAVKVLFYWFLLLSGCFLRFYLFLQNLKFLYVASKYFFLWFMKLQYEKGFSYYTCSGLLSIYRVYTKYTKMNIKVKNVSFFILKHFFLFFFRLKIFFSQKLKDIKNVLVFKNKQYENWHE